MTLDPSGSVLSWFWIWIRHSGVVAMMIIDSKFFLRFFCRFFFQSDFPVSISTAVLLPSFVMMMSVYPFTGSSMRTLYSRVS